MIFIGYVVMDTDRAFLFQDHHWEKPDWLPKSQVDVLREEDTHEVRMIASAWICDQKRIEEFKFRSEQEITDANSR